MTTLINNAQLATVLLGRRLTGAGPLTMPATTTTTLFTVTGGDIAVTSFAFAVTTVVQTQANAIKLVATPSGAGAATDICATVESSAAAVGSIFAITGLPSAAMIKYLGGAYVGCSTPLIVKPGTVGLNTAATNTGAVGNFVLTYVPLADASTVVFNV